MLRYLHTFGRFIWLLIIPMLVAPVIAAFIMASNSSYTATAALWVEQPIYTEQQRNVEGSFWDSPATQTANLLHELMSTRAFLTTVLEDTSLRNLVKSEADTAALLDYINKNFTVSTGGWRLINLSFKDKYAAPALEVLQSIVDKFKAYYDDRIARQGQGATSYYQDRVKAAQESLDKANQALVDYLNAHPNEVGSEGATRAVRPEDLEFANLTQNRDAARKQYDDAKAALEKVQNSYGAYLQGQDTRVTVQDKPEVYSAIASKTRDTVMGAGIGFGIGLVLAIIGTIVLTLLDKTIRQPFYVQRTLGVGRVMEIENANPVRGWYKWRKAKMLAQLEKSNLALPAPATVEGAKARPKVKPRFILRRSYGERVQLSPLE